MTENLNLTSESTVCSVFDTNPYVIVAAVSAGTAMASGLCCIFVICLIFLFKKHYFFTQRIIIYHCLASLFRAFSVILRLHRLGYDAESTAQNILCTISGFTHQLTLWCIMIDYAMITFTLLMSAVFQKNVARLEFLYIVLIFIFPLTFTWIPFIGNSYGRGGVWCWIRNVNYDDCSEYRLGEIFRIILWYVPLFSLLFIMVSVYLFTIIYVARQRFCKRKKNTKTSHDLEAERLKKHLNEEVWPILFLPFGVVLLNIFLLINSFFILIDIEPSYTIWILQGIFTDFQGGFVALVYVLDCNTLRRLTYSNIKATVTRRDTVHEYPVESADGAVVSDSAEYSPVTHYRQYENDL